MASIALTSRRSWAISVSIPHSSLLRAAVRWLELLPDNSPERCIAILTNTAKNADLPPSQYYAARQWLVKHGIWTGSSSDVVLSSGSTVFVAAISEAIWFADASHVITAPAELPLDALEAASACGIDENGAYALIRHHHGLVDIALRKSVGDAGERHLVELLRACTTCQVEHVAALSDGYGYDISLTGIVNLHLEVKTTSRLNQNVIYVSRHEFETMRRDPLWRLIFVRLGGGMALERIFTVDTSWLGAAAPVDTLPGVVDWQSFRLDVPGEQLRVGLSDIDNALRAYDHPHGRLLVPGNW